MEIVIFKDIEYVNIPRTKQVRCARIYDDPDPDKTKDIDKYIQVPLDKIELYRVKRDMIHKCLGVARPLSEADDKIQVEDEDEKTP